MNTRIRFAFAALLFSCGPQEQPSTNNGDDNNGDDNNGEERECRRDSDCEELHVCNRDDECEPGACLDGKQSVGETGVDCGGSTCPKCANGEVCKLFTDCESGSCIGNLCVDPPANNGENNGDNNGAATCEDPGDADRFVLWEGTGLEVDVGYPAGTMSAAPVITGGLGLFDFDDDGDLDVMVGNQGGDLKLFANDGSGSFTDVTDIAGLAGLTKTGSISVADFDGDSDADVVVGRTEDSVYVLENQGNGTFVDATSAWGIGGSEGVVSGATFGDYDGDGDLDLYVAGYAPEFQVTFPFEFPAPRPNQLYRNDGTSFTPMAFSDDLGGANNAGYTLAVAWWDYDGDGDLDLWSSNDFGPLETPSQLWRNDGADAANPDGWLFTDVSDATNVGVAIFGMSATLADFDNDGDQDGYATNMAQNVLHVLDNGATTNESVARGVDVSVVTDPRPRPLTPPDYRPKADGMEEFLADYADAESEHYTLTSFGSVFFDADQDGWQDLFVVNGTTKSDFTPEATHQPNYLLMNDGAGSYSTAECWRTPDIRGTSRGAAVGDLDGDGDLDVVFADQGDYGDAGVFVLRNEIAAGNWLSVKLVGASPNTDAIGAKVELTTASGTQTRWIDGGQGFMSVSERVAHFGFGDDDSIVSLAVTWPDGASQSVDAANINEKIVVTQ